MKTHEIAAKFLLIQVRARLNELEKPLDLDTVEGYGWIFYNAALDECRDAFDFYLRVNCPAHFRTQHPLFTRIIGIKQLIQITYDLLLNGEEAVKRMNQTRVARLRASKKEENK